MINKLRSKSCYRIFVIIGLLFLSNFIIVSYSSVFASVVINEIFPKTEDISQEWIELYNNGNSPVSLDRWKVENNSGAQKTFMLNASSIIPEKGFLLLNQSRYGFTLGKDGDTIRLFDSNNTLIDSQSYQGILGYNMSVGRTSDGVGVWAYCTTPTRNSSNLCPDPTPTSTPLPTSTPMNTHTPFPTDPPMVMEIPSLTLTPSITLPSVEHSSSQSSPTTDSIEVSIPKKLLVVVAGIVVVWCLVAIVILIKNR